MFCEEGATLDMDRGNVRDLNVEELADYLLGEGICSEVLTNFATNRISGSVSLKLTEDELKDLVPIIGVRTEIRDILSKVRLDFKTWA